MTRGVAVSAEIVVAPRQAVRAAWPLLLVLLLAPGLAAADEPAPNDTTGAGGVLAEESPPADGDALEIGYGFAIGYGHGIVLRSRQRGRDVADVQVLTFEPQVRLLVARLGDGRSWYHGDLDGTLEGLLMFNFSPHGGHAGGVNAGLRYRMRRERRVQPFVEGALGIGGVGFDLASQDDGFTFFIQAGAGARYRLGERFAVSGSLRWNHVSNAQTHLPNTGIDTIGFRIGIETP